MAVTKENYTGIIDEIIRNYRTTIIKNTSTVQEIRIENNQRASVRDQVESSLRAQGITYGELTRNVGSFGGTEIVLFGKKLEFYIQITKVRVLVLVQVQHLLDYLSLLNVLMLRLHLGWEDLLLIMM